MGRSLYALNLHSATQIKKKQSAYGNDIPPYICTFASMLTLRPSSDNNVEFEPTDRRVGSRRTSTLPYRVVRFSVHSA